MYIYSKILRKKSHITECDSFILLGKFNWTEIAAEGEALKAT